MAFAAAGPTCLIDRATILRHSSLDLAASSSPIILTSVLPGSEGRAIRIVPSGPFFHFGLVQAARTQRKSPVGSPPARTSCQIHTSRALSAVRSNRPASPDRTGVWGAGTPSSRWTSAGMSARESMTAPSQSVTPRSTKNARSAAMRLVRPSSASTRSVPPSSRALSASGRRLSGSVSHRAVSSPSASTSRAPRPPM